MEVESLRQLMDWQPPNVETIISGGLLLPQTRLVIFGQWKSWKSMTALHTSFCLASGAKWFGFDTKESTLLSLQLEIPKAEFRKRVIKYASGHNLYPTNLWFITEHYLKLDRDWGFQALDRAVAMVQPDIVVIDPLYKVLTGHISDPRDMMGLLDNFDRLIAKYNVALIIVTHTRKPGTDEEGHVIDRGAEEMMGSSFLPNWCDTAVGVRRVSEHSDDIEVSFPLTRNSEEELKPMLIHINRNNLKFERISLHQG
jgi:RecA-family ATPase